MSGCTKSKSVLAWQGTRVDGTTKHLKVKEAIGIKTCLKGSIILCENALHGSICAIDMLQHSKGLWVKRTLHEGAIAQDLDKIGSSERTVVAEADATQVILDWAFWCADRAIRVHAVAALRYAGMTTEAEKLFNLESISDKKSARTACLAARNIYIANYTEASVSASIAANAVDSAIYAFTHSKDYMGAYAAAAAADQAACAATYAARISAVPEIVVNNPNYAVEMFYLNAELESRLLALMGITETESGN